MTGLATIARPAPQSSAERQRAYRERNRAQDRARHGTSSNRRKAAITRRPSGDDPGPAIDPGEPFKDDLMWTEAEWTRRLAGARFCDVSEPRF